MMAGSFDSTSPERVAALHAIRDRHAGQSGPVQCARLLEALQTQGHVTTFEASRFLDVYDPRARKMSLVRAGHSIVMSWRMVPTESGKLHRLGVYALARGGA